MSSHKSRLSEFQAQATKHGCVWVIGPLAQNAPAPHLLTQAAVMAIDGGVDALPPQQVHYSVGDGDSAKSSANLDELLSINKDTSDLSIGLERIPRAVKIVHLWGFSGARFDHELCNLGAIHQFLLNHQAKVILHTQRQTALLAFPSGEHQLEINGTFSLLSLQETHFTITGDCHYPLLSPTLLGPLSAHGLSNIGQGKLSITADGPFFCIQERL